MNEVVLQHIVIPSGIVNDIDNLYSSTHSEFPVTLPSGEVLDFRAHFNLIPVGVFRRSGISEIDIRLDGEGNGHVSAFIDDADEPLVKGFIDDPVITVDISRGELLGITVVAGDGGCKFFGGHISCQVNGIKEVRLALVICTYRREDIVVPKIERIKEFIESNGLDELVKLVIVDNSGMLGIPDVIHSKNLGGSAGFTRGIIEAKRLGCTHVILNDDDALFDPEILFRTLSLLKIADNAVIGGTMLSLEEPNKVYESGALCEGPELYPLKRGIDITTIQGNLSLTKKERMNYTGWWYSVFPLSMVERIGYPLPFFFKEDDVEYGLRSDIDKITVCGISVWHPVPKYDLSVNYYYVRNHLSMMASHGMLSGRNVKAFILKILLETSAYRYQGAETMISGMKDFMRGPDYVYNSCKDGPIRCSMEFSDMDELRKEDDFTSESPKCGFFIRLITMNGLLLPSKGCTEKGARDMETKDFYRMGKILYSTGNGKGFIAVRKRARTISLVIRTLSLWFRLFLKKGRLSRRYVDALQKYSTEESWKELLEIDQS